MPTVRCFTSLTLALSLVCATSLIAQPPAELHQVGDHWTAWDPPPVGEDDEVYIIQAGDTLWSLAEQLLGDPYLWPQLWEQNQWVLDAHWIYPGDPLILSAEMMSEEMAGEAIYDETTGEMMPGPGEVVEPAGSDLIGFVPADRSLTAPAPLGSESDIYCGGYLGAPELEFAHRIVGSETQVLGLPDSEVMSTKFAAFSDDGRREVMATGDIVYIDGGRSAGLSPGLLFSVVWVGPMVEHPRTEETVGRFYRYEGRLRLLSVQEESSIAEVVHSCRAINVGMGLVPFEPEPIPLGRLAPPHPSTAPIDASQLDGAPTIVHTDERLLLIGEGSLVYVDRGEVDDLTPGDLFTIYRRNKEGFPPVVIGELAILSVRQQSALGRVMRSRYTVRIGDQLSPR